MIVLDKDKCFTNLEYVKEKMSVKVDTTSPEQLVYMLEEISSLLGLLTETLASCEYHYHSDKTALNRARLKYSEELNGNAHYRMNSLMSNIRNAKSEQNTSRFQPS